jgi:uncharacterized protein (TIGR02466 family)
MTPRPQIHSLFPTPVFESVIPVQKKWMKAVENLNYHRTATDNGWISYERNIWEIPDLKDLQLEIKDAIKYFAHEYLNVSHNVYMDVVRGWGVKHGENDWAQNHCHMNAVFSGVYYLDVGPDSGDLVFEKGQHFPNCFMPTLEPDCDGYNLFTGKSWRWRPETGKIIAFPSQLIHNVEKNLSGRTRYCIGFDVFPRGTFGYGAGSGLTVH